MIHVTDMKSELPSMADDEFDELADVVIKEQVRRKIIKNGLTDAEVVLLRNLILAIQRRADVRHSDARAMITRTMETTLQPETKEKNRT